MGHLSQFIIKHWELWLALIAILILILVNEYLIRRKQAKELSPQAVVNLINHENAVVVDLREPDAFRSGHIIDAIQATPDDFAQQRMDKYKGKTIILVCARGLQSAQFAPKVQTQGFAPVMVLAGGITAWQTAGLPLVKGK